MSVIISGDNGISDVDGSAGTPAIRGTDANTGIFFPAADTIAFAEGGAEAMRIDSGGQIAIGTTTADNFGNPSNRGITLNGQTAGTAGFIELQSNGVFRFAVVGNDSAATMYAGNGLPIIFQTGSPTASERARIDSLGSLLINETSNGYGVTGGIYAPSVYTFTTASAANMFIESGGFFRRSTSSIKYKTDVQDATHGLTEVLQLRPVTYKGKNDGDTVFGGLIAEEVHEAGLTEFVQYADDGTPDALAYGNMVSLAFKAIQELKAINDAQASRIETLEAKVAALEAK
jgi:hypothetical protein